MDTLTTFSKFYYGFEVTSENFNLPFSEGGGELNAEVRVGSFTLTQMASELETALNNEGFLNYTVTVNRTTRVFTIAASGNFQLLPVTGTLASTSVYSLVGFTTDRTGAATYAGNTAGGFVWSPQFRAQNYIPMEHWTGAALATVNKAASGRVEVIKFGNESFMQASFMYITDIAQTDEDVIKNDANAVDNVLSFLRYAITKGPMEFMPDADDPSEFYNVLLESTPDSKDGVSFRLLELYDKGLPGWYETGTLKFRQVED